MLPEVKKRGKVEKKHNVSTPQLYSLFSRASGLRGFIAEGKADEIYVVFPHNKINIPKIHSLPFSIHNVSPC